MKEQRQHAILSIIRNNIVKTQDELLASLEEKGYPSTQATISRDIKELALSKIVIEGHLRYWAGDVQLKVLPSTEQLISDNILSMTAAQNIVVVKTLPGLAMAICTAFDQQNIDGLVGTLAGDDTCILIMTTNQTAEVFAETMMQKFT